MNYVKILWIWFWVEKEGRCPKCLRTLLTFNDFRIEFSYCPRHPLEAYYDDGTKVKEL